MKQTRKSTARSKRRGPRKASPKYLERAALHYLERYGTTRANLERVLARKVARSVEAHGTDPEEARTWIAALLDRLERAGLLDDRGYAESKARSLRRRGQSLRGIAAKLAERGVPGEIVDAVLQDYRSEEAEPDLAAAIAFARRRRIGPYREAAARPEAREKDLAALARRGFSYDVARRVIEADDVEDLEAEAGALTRP